MESEQLAEVPEFATSIEKPKTRALYQLGLLLTALCMVLLPSLYLLLIGGVAWYVFKGLEQAVSGDFSDGTKGRIYAIVALLAVGGTIVFFLLKPLLARRERPPRPMSIERERQPLFFAFVDRTCEVVGAPRPRRIDVDTEVNASASFRRGFLSMLSSDLVLTVGLPLVNGLTVREFGGVLAHEFGHFSQGAGMRLTYIIRSVNGWFARVVYERDAWDQGLQSWANESGDLRLMILGHLAKAGVWVARAILSGLMRVGHTVSCFALRQMEYDADRHQTEVAGADAFEATARRLPVLAAGGSLALDELGRAWEQKTLVDDLPRFVVERAMLLPRKQREQIEEDALTEATQLFDTHPSMKDRVAAARRIGSRGVLREDRAAVTLFGGYEQLCRDATRHFYAERLGEDAKSAKLLSSESLLKIAAGEQLAFQALHSMLAEQIDVEVVTLSAPTRPIKEEPHSVADRVRRLRARKVAPRSGNPDWTVLEEKEAQLAEQAMALAAWRAGRRPDLLKFGLDKKAGPDDLDLGLRRTSAERAELRQRCRASIAPVLDRIELALAVLASDSLRRLVPDSETHQVQANQWADVHRAIEQAQSLRDRLALSYPSLQAVAQVVSDSDRSVKIDQAWRRANDALGTDIAALREVLDRTPLPSDGPREISRSIGASIAPEEIPDNAQERYDAAGAALGGLYQLQTRALAHLSAVTLAVENALFQAVGSEGTESRAGA